MIKELWLKLKKNHLLLMVVCCGVPIILIYIYFYFFKDNGIGDKWIWIIFLLCPVMHIWMMKGHTGSDHSVGHKGDKKSILYKCPECGFEYKEKEWADKCEAWCRENKTCNLEITKHAIQ